MRNDKLGNGCCKTGTKGGKVITGGLCVWEETSIKKKRDQGGWGKGQPWAVVTHVVS